MFVIYTVRYILNKIIQHWLSHGEIFIFYFLPYGITATVNQHLFSLEKSHKFSLAYICTIICISKWCSIM